MTCFSDPWAGCRYALDVNIERAEDVLTHKLLLAEAKDPEKRPVFRVRAVHVSWSLPF